MKPHIYLISLVFTLILASCDNKSAQLQKQIDKLKDKGEVENLMGRRAFYHSAGRNDLEFDNWSKREDISWGNNFGFMLGQASIKKFYVTDNVSNRKRDLEKQSKLFPQLNNDEKNLGAGIFVMHTLTTPIIEVAEDGQTAKGVWYTPGTIVMPDAKGNPDGNWMWERYAVDFIKEDGKWKFWHLLILTDYLSGFNKPFQVGFDAAQVVGKPIPMPEGMPKWDQLHDPYYTWGPVTVQKVEPRLPEPYKTFSETFSYGTK